MKAIVQNPSPPDVLNEESLKFIEESPSLNIKKEEDWQVLVVDDEFSVFEVTKLALSDFQFRERSINFIYASSTHEAQNILKNNSNIALAMIDVVMEHKSSGLELVRFIRENLNNNKIQIILRTGQPGDIPAETVVQHYGINDYKVKTDLTREKLFTSVTVALRSFAQSSSVFDLANRLMVSNNRLNMINANLESQVEERTKELAQKSAELESAFMTTCNLLRIVTHDQKNYVTIIMSRAKMLAQMIQDYPQMKKQIDSILWAVQFQKDIIQKISTFESLRSGKSIYDFVPTPLQEIIRQSALTFEAQLQAKQLNLVIENNCPIDTKIFVDPTIFVSSILNNLLSNAVKFSPEKAQIIVRSSIDPSTSEVVLSVIDKGIGMPAAHLTEIFSFASKTTRMGTSGERGTGFGMPIVKALIEKMGGRIHVSSQEKVEGSNLPSGTTFSLWIPLAK